MGTSISTSLRRLTHSRVFGSVLSSVFLTLLILLISFTPQPTLAANADADLAYLRAGGCGAIPATVTNAGQLIAAITTANCDPADNTINLQTGIYTLSAVNNTDPSYGSNGLPIIVGGKGKLVINGNSAIITRDTASGTPLFRIFEIGSGGDLTINQLVLGNGNTPSSGGGLFNNGGTLTVNSSWINGNSALTGGGITNYNGTLTISNNSNINGNTASGVNFGGGGILNLGTAVITDSAVNNNTANAGAGIDNEQVGTLSLTNVSINNNIGEGIRNFGATVTILGSTFDANAGTGIVNLISGYMTISGSTISNNLHSGILQLGNSLSISGSTIRDNSTSGAGGGIDVNGGATLSISDSTVSGNKAFGDGGGIFSNLYLNLTNVIVTNNTADSDNNGSGTGGGVHSEAVLSAKNSTFTGNSAAIGGGLYYSPAQESGSIVNSTFSSNQAQFGGGLYNDTAEIVNPPFTAPPQVLSIVNSTFNNNQVTSSGGALASYGLLKLINSTVTGNKAASNGGGVYNNTAGTLTLINDTITSNDAGSPGTGGGVRNEGSTTAYNTIIAANTHASSLTDASSDCGGAFTTASYNLVGSGTGCTTEPHTVIVTPSTVFTTVLSALANNGGLTFTEALILTSPAINAGDMTKALDQNGAALANDQRGTGFSRVLHGQVDIGAYEALVPAPVITTQPQSQLIASGRSTTLSVAASGTGLSYQWYQGSSGTTTTPVGTNSASFTTPAINAATNYWVQITNTGGSVNSTTAAITVYFPDFTVDTVADDANLSTCSTAAGDCSLRGVIILTNAIGGTHSVLFSPLVYTPNVIALGSELTSITSNLNIDGLGKIKIDGSGLYRPFIIRNGVKVNLSGLTLSNSGGNSFGGAINNDGILTVNNVSFTGNKANIGAGLYNVRTAVVINSTFSGNVVTGRGGAIANEGGTLLVINSTLSGNSAPATRGGGLYNRNTAVLTFDNSIVANSVNGGDCIFISGTFSASHSLIKDSANACGIVTGVNSNVVGTDPLLGALTGSPAYFPLNPASPVINAGDNSLLSEATVNTDLNGDGDKLDTISLDQTGAARIVYTTVDMGAVESTAPIITTQPQSQPVISGRSATLSVAASGTGLSYHWYQGSSGITTTPVGTNSASFTTPALSAVTNYWVQVSNGAGSINSATATISPYLPNFIVDTTLDTNLSACSSAAGDCSLRGAINLANSYPGTDSITFDSSIFNSPKTITLTGNLPQISTSMSITGPSANPLTVDGTHQYQPFYISGSPAPTVTISLLTIANGAASNGGGLYGDNGASITVSNSTFSNNAATPGSGGGGAIDLYGAGLTVSDSSFTGNSASTGGAIFMTHGTQLAVTNSSFTGNTASSGGAIYTFFHDGDQSVSGSTFSNNSTDSAGYGGALYSYSSSALSVSNSTFSNNSAGYGGAIKIDGGSGLSLSGDMFTGNTATSSNGGAVSNNGSTILTVSSSTFSGNTANGSGGGVYNNFSTLTVNSSTFTGNTAISDGAGLLNNGTGAGVIANSAFDSNSSTQGGGGGIAQFSGTLALINSTLSGNSSGGTSSYMGGGGLYTIGTSSPITIINSTIANNSATMTARSGLWTYNTPVTIQNSIVANNNGSNNCATSDVYYLIDGGHNLDNGMSCGFGGAVGQNSNPLLGSLANNGGSSKTLALLAGSPAINEGDNSLAVDENGAALATDQRGAGFARIQGTIVDIGAYELNAALTAPTITVQPQGQTIVNGRTATLSVTASGASLSYQWYEGSTGTLTTPVGTNSASFTTPTLNSTTNYWVRVSNLAGNADSSSAAITVYVPDFMVDTTSDANLNVCSSALGDCSLRGAINLANNYAGADTIRFDGTIFGSAQTITLIGNLPSITDDLTITGPGASLLTVDGGQQYQLFAVGEDKTVSFSGMTMANGSATDAGGAIFGDYGSTLTVSESTFSNNAAGDGGAIFSKGALTVTNSIFVNNRASDAGGAISSAFELLTVSNSSFSSNSATYIGGGISSFGSLAVTNSTIDHNTTDLNGGGIASFFGTATIVNSTIADNSSNGTDPGSGGGGVYIATFDPAVTVTIIDSTIANNTAAQTGFSGVWVDSGTLVIENSIVANNNGANNCAVSPDAILNDGGHNLDNGMSCGFGGTVGQNTDPLLDTSGLQNNGGSLQTIALQADSPAINGGDNALIAAGITMDEAGNPRIRYGTVDIGAYEAAIAAPTISTPPPNQAIFKGQTAMLTVVASGSRLNYQWYQGSSGTTTTPVGTNSDSFTTPALSTTTTYWVRVTNLEGSADSASATITVQPAPTITTQPQSQTIFNGQTADLSVVASGAGLNYQWYQGNRGVITTPVGTNSASFTTPVLTATTRYWVQVSNPAGSVNSATTTITVQPVPTAINTQPQNQTIFKKQTASLSVTAVGTNLTYRWYIGLSGDMTLPIGGAVSSSYTTPALNVTTSYWVRVVGTGGTVNSDSVTITVLPAPTITTQPHSQSIFKTQTATLTVVASGDSLSYQWYQGSSGDVSLPVGTNSDSLTTDPLTATTRFWVQISNPAGKVNSATATVTVLPAPTITHQPVNRTIYNAQTATLTVTASGSGLVYQWYQGVSGDSSVPVGTNSASFTSDPLTATTTFWVQVSNPAGSVNSSSATVTVRAAPSITVQPLNKTIWSGQTTSLLVTATGTSMTYQWYQGDSGDVSQPISGATTRVLTTPVLTATTHFWVQVSDPGNNHANSITAIVTVRAAPSITTQPLSPTINSGRTARLTVVASGVSLHYQWYQGLSGDTSSAVSGATSSVYTTPVLTSDASYWVRVTNLSGSADSLTAMITVLSMPSILVQPQSLNTLSGSPNLISVTASGGNLSYTWYQGNSGDTSAPYPNSNSDHFNTPPLDYDANYWVRVTNTLGSVNSASATLHAETPPMISTQPQNLTTPAGFINLISVTASGSDLSYTWYQGNSGDTSAPYPNSDSDHFNTPPLDHDASYWVRVSNDVGSADSATATVHIVSAAVITVQPQSQTVAGDQPTSLSVTASGENLSYVWYLGESGDTSAPYPNTNSDHFYAPPSDHDASYWVQVSNLAGNVNSDTATISIEQPGTIQSLAITPPSDSSGTGDTSDSTDIPQQQQAQATHLVFVQQPSDAASGGLIAPAITVEVRDGNDFPVLVDGVAVTVSIGSNPGGATLGGTVTVNSVGGLATFSNVSLNQAGEGYTLTASSAGLSEATSDTFNVTAAPLIAGTLTFVSGVPPYLLTEGAPISDTFGMALDHAPSADVTVTISSADPANLLLVDPSQLPNVVLVPQISITFAAGSQDIATVQLAAAADDLAEGVENTEITFAVSSADASFNGISVAAQAVQISDAAVVMPTDTPTEAITSTPTPTIDDTVTPTPTLDESAGADTGDSAAVSTDVPPDSTETPAS